MDSSVGIVTRLWAGWLESLGLIPGRNKRFLFSITSSQFLGPLGTRGCFPKGKTTGVELTTHLHLVVRLRMIELYLHSPIHLHGVMLNFKAQG
jgi:hypothetical protein